MKKKSKLKLSYQFNYSATLFRRSDQQFRATLLFRFEVLFRCADRAGVGGRRRRGEAGGGRSPQAAPPAHAHRPQVPPLTHFRTRAAEYSAAASVRRIYFFYLLFFCQFIVFYIFLILLIRFKNIMKCSTQI